MTPEAGSAREMEPPFQLGTKTKWGEIVAIGSKDGERWYMAQKDNLISLMSHDDVKALLLPAKAAKIRGSAK